MNKKLIIIGVIVVIVIFALTAFMFRGTEDSDIQNNNVESDNDINNNNSVIEIDESLTDKELIDSLNSKVPETIKCKIKTTSEDNELANTESIMYFKNYSTRIETTNEEGNYIIIFNNTDKTTYMYDPNTKVGTELKDIETDKEDDINVSLNISNEEYDIARVEELNGEKVIYTEYEDYGTVTKTYYSVKYAIPLLIEEYEDGNLIMKQEITDIQVDVKLNDDLFEKPSDVEFSDMSSIFDF